MLHIIQYGARKISCVKSGYLLLADTFKGICVVLVVFGSVNMRRLKHIQEL